MYSGTCSQKSPGRWEAATAAREMLPHHRRGSHGRRLAPWDGWSRARSFLPVGRSRDLRRRAGRGCGGLATGGRARGPVAGASSGGSARLVGGHGRRAKPAPEQDRRMWNRCRRGPKSTPARTPPQGPLGFVRRFPWLIPVRSDSSRSVRPSRTLRGNRRRISSRRLRCFMPGILEHPTRPKQRGFPATVTPGELCSAGGAGQAAEGRQARPEPDRSGELEADAMGPERSA